MSAAGTERIDRVQLRALLRAFFRMNFRGSLTQQGRSGKNLGIFWILFFYILIGGVTGMAVTRIDTPVFFFLLMHGITFTLLGMVVLVESGQIMFNPHEDDVLGHLPISPKTIVAAKLLNLAGFAFLLATAFNLAPMFLALKLPGVRWWTPLTHFLSLIPISFFCAGGVVLIYGLVARLVGRERFETVISWAQVLMTVFFVVGYQMLGPVMRQIHTIDIDHATFLWALPPRWFAALDTVMAEGGGAIDEWLGAGIALSGTVAVVLLGIARLASGRERQAVLAATTEPKKKKHVVTKEARPLAPWLRWWLRDPAESGAFRLAAAYMSRDKDVRHRLYPSLAMVVVFPLFFLFNKTEGKNSDFFVYMCLWMLATLPLSTIETLRMSKDWQAADVYYYSPLEGGAALFHGVRKAALYYATLPCAVLLVALLGAIAPEPAATLRNAFAMLIPIPTISLLSGLRGNYLPLSKPAKTGDQSRTTQGTFLMMTLTLPIFMFGMYALMQAVGYWAALAIELPLVVVAHRLLSAATRRPRAIIVE